MHYDGVAAGQFQARGRHLVAGDVVLQADFLAGQAFFLDAEEHDYVGAAERVFDVAGDAQAGGECGGDVGHELGRAAERELYAELGEQVAGAAGDAAVKDVTDDGGLQTFERLFVFQNREGIEQRLRRMLMHAVAGVDDGDVEMLCHEVRRARGRMANDDTIRAHRPQSVPGIEKRLAFFDARSRGLHERGDRAQRFGGEFERRASAGRRLVKQKYDALAAEQRTHLQRIHAPGQFQQAEDVLRVEVFDPQQRTACGFIHRKKCKRCIIRGRRGRCKAAESS
jgi:hypothetical protein